MEIVLDQSGFRQVGHIVPILFALGGDGEGGKRWRSLLDKLKHSLASLEKLETLFSKLFFPKVKLENPK